MQMLYKFLFLFSCFWWLTKIRIGGRIFISCRQNVTSLCDFCFMDLYNVAFSISRSFPIPWILSRDFSLTCKPLFSSFRTENVWYKLECTRWTTRVWTISPYVLCYLNCYPRDLCSNQIYVFICFCFFFSNKFLFCLTFHALNYFMYHCFQWMHFRDLNDGDASFSINLVTGSFSIKLVRWVF